MPSVYVRLTDARRSRPWNNPHRRVFVTWVTERARRQRVNLTRRSESIAFSRRGILEGVGPVFPGRPPYPRSICGKMVGASCRPVTAKIG